MASEIIDGSLIPLRVAGHPVLELCNTGAGWPAMVTAETLPAKDYLIDAAALASWAAVVGWLDADEATAFRRAAGAAPGQAELARLDLIGFRRELYGMLTARSAADGLGLVHRRVVAAIQASRYRLMPGGAGWRLDGGPEVLSRPLHRLVLATDRFLSDPGPAAVGRCPGVGCGWLFLHQGGRRRWCIMAVCGNRAKARRRSVRVRGLDAGGADTDGPVGGGSVSGGPVSAAREPDR